MKKEKVVFKGRRFSVIHSKLKTRSGKVWDTEVVARHPSVAVIAINDKNEILLTREYRHHHHKYIWRMPGGEVDKGWTPLKAGQRELREEAGYRAKKWKLFYKSSQYGGSLYRMYVYLAKGLVHLGTKLEDEEIILVKPVSMNRAKEVALAKGFYNEILSFAILKLWHERKKWIK